jgi:hypothetical protein
MKTYLQRIDLWACIDNSNRNPEKIYQTLSDWEKDFEVQSNIHFHVSETLMYLITHNGNCQGDVGLLRKTVTIGTIIFFLENSQHIRYKKLMILKRFSKSWCSLLGQGTIIVGQLCTGKRNDYNPVLSNPTLADSSRKMHQGNTFEKP